MGIMRQKRVRSCWQGRIKRAMRKISLVDKCLILIMSVLMMQCAFILFEPKTSDQTNPLDVVTRTSAASIFGYFISANFIRKQEDDTNAQLVVVPPATVLADPAKGPTAQIGFSAAEEPKTELTANPATMQQSSYEQQMGMQHEHLQVVVTTAIGLFSLCLLIVYRNFGAQSVAATGTLSQLRDFVSGCVGFLIGSTTRQINKA